MIMNVSILITSHNQVEYLAEAVDSALQQTTQPMEVIISDDCSHDGSQDFIKGLEKSHKGLIRAFLHSENIGIPRNKSYAIEQARGDWIIGLDGDDRLLPGKIERSLAASKANPQAKLIFGNFLYIDEKGEQLRVWATDQDPVPPQGFVFKHVFCKDYPKRTLFRNEMIHLESLKQTGLYDPEMTIYEDWEIRVRLASRFPVAYCPETLSEYRLHSGGISRVDPAFHAKFIRLIYKKNAHLLKDLPDDEKIEVQRKFQQILSGYSRSAIKTYMKSGQIFKGIKSWVDERRFNSRYFGHGQSN